MPNRPPDAFLWKFELWGSGLAGVGAIEDLAWHIEAPSLPKLSAASAAGVHALEEVAALLQFSWSRVSRV